MWREHGWGLGSDEAWGLRSGQRESSLERGTAAQAPGSWPPAPEREGEILGLGPVSEPLLAVAWVSYVKRSRAVPPQGMPREVCLPLSPHPSFSSTLARPP